MAQEGLGRLIVEGGHALHGNIRVNGSKNAAMGAMAAALLVEEDCVLHNVPDIGDVEQMARVLRSLGGSIDWQARNVLRINAAGLNSSTAPTDIVGNLRGSFLVMGALLGRLGEAACAPPGGDVIGQRPIDVHLAGFAALGADVARDAEKYMARADRLKGATVFCDYPSVLGTQNLMLAAVTAEGTTSIVNAAAEPEVQGTAAMLQSMGAKIAGAGSHTIVVEGTDRLHGTEYEIIPDRLEAGTFAIAGAITRGEVRVEGACLEHLTSLIFKLREMGVDIVSEDETLWVRGVPGKLRATSIQALPYPGLATDLQAPVAVLLTQAHGVSYVHERVFDNRLLYAGELRKLGADVVTTGTTTAIISGPTPLVGASVRALDVRAGAALILAGLAASGRTEITDIYHVDRGYEHIDERLRSLGAVIERA
jgi:UDP-N-acetylglucosamine 1-carboxyvinyltransferase